MLQSPPGVNIAGHFCYPSGLREAALALTESLESAGVRTSRRNVPVPWGIEEGEPLCYLGDELYGVTIIHVQPEPLFNDWAVLSRIRLRDDARRVAYWYWESDKVPVGWADVVARNELKEIWVATNYAAEAFAPSVPVPVRVLPPGIGIPAFPVREHTFFGLPSGKFTFLYMLDAHSCLARKNPIAAIRAFGRAFRSNDQAQLVLRVRHPEYAPKDYESIRAAAAGMENVLLLDGALSREESYALINLCDCYVSLHRAEGWGLTMAEAMLMRKPVIATGHSGNTDFMTETNSYLVSYQMQPFVRIAPYEDGTLWADPSVEHAAELMLQVYRNRDEAMARAERAREEVSRILEPRRAGSLMAIRIEQLGGEVRATSSKDLVGDHGIKCDSPISITSRSLEDSIIPALKHALESLQQGRLVEAEVICRAIIGREPNFAPAVHLLGLVAHRCSHSTEAVDLLKRASILAPEVPDFHNKLGAAFGALGSHEDALSAIGTALRLNPECPEAYHNLGVTLERLGRLGDAAAAYSRAAKLDPQNGATRLNFANVLHALGRTEEAIVQYRKLAQLRPQDRAITVTLAALLCDGGYLQEAVAAYRAAIAAQAEVPAVHSDLLYVLHFDPRSSPASLLEEARRWESHHALPMARSTHVFANSRTENRRLRIGYVSPDFRQHTIPHLIAPVLAAHDRDHFEVFGYSAVAQPDETTDHIRSLLDHWRDIAGVTNERAAELIEQDRIDILVDLAGHMASNRMQLFARKPAPVQVQLGYAGTTGLNSIDYRITDAHSDPVGAADAFYAEKLIRMPDCAWCYGPSEPSPKVGTLPALTSGHLTFGCLNKFIKVSDSAIELWCEILQCFPDSKLVLLGGSSGSGSYIADRFETRGVPPERLEVSSRFTRLKYLELYNHIDVGLDTFPYNGDTTTCDALWMGVPVVSLAGELFVSRRGLSHLSNVGLSWLVASTSSEYLTIVRSICSDLNALAALRVGLRERFLRSPICDGPNYTRHLEKAYRDIWKQWCADVHSNRDKALQEDHGKRG